MGLKSNIVVQNLDICCFRDYCFSNMTTVKVQTQETTVKDHRPKKPKAKKIKPVYVNAAKPLEQDKKERKKKKKKFQEKKEQKHTPTTSNNAINTLKKEKKKRNTSKIVCFICNKKSHYTSNYTKVKN